MSAGKTERTSGSKSMDKENRIKAMKAVRNKEMEHLAPSKKYNVHRSTLCAYVRSNSNPFQATQSKLGA
jgi:hypothetical protein